MRVSNLNVNQNEFQKERPLVVNEKKSKEMTGYASIDRPHLKGKGDPEITIKDLDKITIFDYIYEGNKDYPDQNAIVFHGNKIKFSEFFRNVEETYKALLKSGVKKGDKIGICSLSTPETIYLVYALSKIGALIHMINPLMEKDTLIEINKGLPCSKYFVLDGMIPLMKEIVDEKDIIALPTTKSMPPIMRSLANLKLKTPKNNCEKWDDFFEAGKAFEVKDFYSKTYVSDNDELLVAYSSGTTGVPKGVCMSNRAFNYEAEMFKISGMNFPRNNKWLSVVPTFFITGICASVHVPIGIGLETNISITSILNVKNFKGDMAKTKANYTVIANNKWKELSKYGYNNALKNVIYPISGGEAIFVPIEERINEGFAKKNFFQRVFSKNKEAKKLHKAYGQSEIAACATITNEEFNSLGSSGIPLPYVYVAAFDEETGKEKKYGERGVLRIKSPSMMNGYYNNPTATAEYFYYDDNKEIWGNSKDIGHVEQNGEVIVSGRKEDHVFDENNKKVYMFDIKSHILKFPLVEDCEVLPVGPDQKVIVCISIDTRLKPKEVVEMLDLMYSLLMKETVGVNLIRPFAYRVVKKFKASKSGKKDSSFLEDESATYYRIEDGETLIGDLSEVSNKTNVKIPQKKRVRL